MENERRLVDVALGELICPMCIETFTEPRSLHCLHTYCERCLEKLHKTSSRPNSIACPECRADTVLSAVGVRDLPVNFKLKKLVEILSTGEERDCRISSPKEPNLLCMHHENRPLEYYCEPCEALICGQCMLDQHRVHGEVNWASDVLSQHISELQGLIPDAESVIANGEQMLEVLKSEPEKLTAASKEGMLKVKTYFANLRTILDNKEKDVIQGMESQSHRREKLIRKHVSSLSQAVEDMEKAKQLIEDIVERRSSEIVILTQEDKFRARLQASMRRVEEEILDVKETQKEFVKLTPFSPDPSIEYLCRAIDYKTDTPVRSRHYSTDATFQIKTSNNTTEIREGRRDRGRTVAVSSSKHAMDDSCHKQNSTCKEVQPDCLAIHHSHSLNSHKGSPILSPRKTKLTILEPISEIGTKNLIGPYNNVNAFPCGLCCTNEGMLLVTDSKLHLLRFITATGKCLETIGSEGKGEGHFVEPTGTALDGSGNILVVDGKNPGRVQKFSTAGKYMTKFKVRGLITSGYYMSEPIGLVTLKNGNVLVTDGAKSCVHVFDSTGKYMDKFGNVTDFKYPAGIAATDNRVVLADKGNHCVFILTIFGQQLARVGRQGHMAGELYMPYGVALDKDGSIVISECGNHRISIFTSGGKFVRCFGCKGTEPGMFRTPRHICFNTLGQLVVCDEQNQRLQMFDLSNDSS